MRVSHDDRASVALRRVGACDEVAVHVPVVGVVVHLRMGVRIAVQVALVV